ncbi:YaiI/YqxD family protein [Teredinibacter haidensis]|uniref:YaiI/YqxD family protein n=1 Tax=Teredinibacter haidensis TaxID=2731755 RepID=UPI000948993B|nr:YaiI/YqxD family protein [Teredinibacter haidensis]
MAIWVDADACPVVIREILIRASQRTGVEVTFVANQRLALPSIPSVKMLQVMAGFDVADNEIVQRVSPNDLVITNDIPLAAEVIEKSGMVVSHRGEKFTPNNIRARLNMRDFMETMRASGEHGGGPPALSQADRQMFAKVLDGYLAKNPLG